MRQKGYCRPSAQDEQPQFVPLGLAYDFHYPDCSQSGLRPPGQETGSSECQL